MSGALPDGACDAHCHIFGPVAQFPYSPARTYTPAEASCEALATLHAQLGIDRSVIVQPGCHGFDNRVTLHAIAASGGRWRGVALVDEDVTPAHISALDAGGIRGVRFNFVSHLGGPPTLAAFQRIGDLIAPFGWHVVLHVDGNELDQLDPYLAGIVTPFVFDHMARIHAVGGIGQQGFQHLLARMADPLAWVKISGADRVSATGAPFNDVLPFAAALVAAAPERVLWGTDWPHPNIKGPVPKEEALIDLLHRVAPDATILRQILVENPDRLYRFS